MLYHIAWIFGKGKPWRIWRITGGLPNFTIQILTMYRDINKESKKTGISQSFLCQKFVLYSTLWKLTSCQCQCYHTNNYTIVLCIQQILCSQGLSCLLETLIFRLKVSWIITIPVVIFKVLNFVVWKAKINSCLYISMAYIHTVLPRIVAQVFIYFQQFFAPVTKWDKCLLVEDSIIYDANVEFWWKLMTHEVLYCMFNFVTASELYPGH